MKKLKFKNDGFKIELTDKKYVLLFYFVGDFDKYMLEDCLPEIEAVANGE